MAEAERPEPSDAELVAAALAGEVRAFEALLTRYEQKVVRVLRLLGVPTQERDDVAQEVFLRVFRHLDGFRRDRSFGGWIYRVTVNAARDFQGRASRRRLEEAPWSDEMREHPGTDGRVQEGSGEVDLALRLEVALESLSDRERAVFVLLELEGLEVADAARTLGITRITVRRHLGLARARLRTILEQGADPKKPRPR